MNNHSYNEGDLMSNDPSVCAVRCIHAENVIRVKRHALSAEEITGLAEIFKALGDPTRIRILQALSECELCVCDLGAALGMTQSAISHQLRLLRTLRLVKGRKEGKLVFYSLDDDHITNLLAQGLAHIRHI
jgi:DNA-binding transcriptional ArsR family regulator